MGALTLAASLKRVNTSRKPAIMVTTEGWLIIYVIINLAIVIDCDYYHIKVSFMLNFSVFSRIDCT